MPTFPIVPLYTSEQSLLISSLEGKLSSFSEKEFLKLSKYAVQRNLSSLIKIIHQLTYTPISEEEAVTLANHFIIQRKKVSLQEINPNDLFDAIKMKDISKYDCFFLRLSLNNHISEARCYLPPPGIPSLIVSGGFANTPQDIAQAWQAVFVDE